MKPINSQITTALSRPNFETGTPHGEHGSVTLENSGKVAEWLSRQQPEDMNKAAVSRASSHGVGLRVRYEGRFPSGPNGERLPSYMVAVGCDISPNGNHEAALRDLRNFMTPAPMRKIEEWIARLSVTCAKRKDDSFSEELRVVEYASRLSRYPADIAKYVLLHQSYQFFPTWAELEARCEALTGPRRQMIAALERGPEPPEPKRRPPTEEEKARIQSLIDEMFPHRSAEERKAGLDEVLKGDCMTGEPMAGSRDQE
jgi:hypothetical protein